MFQLHALALLLALFGLACHSTSSEAVDTQRSDVTQPLPEVRYYVIADT